ncbi:delta DNA polymerase [Coprinopsis cinerea okayama7|uniref:DNA polymerase delta catalytic subunit n=1 Tax=Coprinopsis cinerea (strain Okayama-7 / 130 / ATCC MYA-4618 / FGSC 9003) TaxID=240176 RepID=A8NRH5_COPC7|nr:delta DNA polymerase [Coprinopsis cinerea okayama7\|eukprot:XP_001835785.2 delta DNA polymerase [Coprinopsis cinerea okayama7\
MLAVPLASTSSNSHELFAQRLTEMTPNVPLVLDDDGSYYFAMKGHARPRPSLQDQRGLVFQPIRLEEGRGSDGTGIINIFGLTEHGSTVMVSVRDYHQWFYMPHPEGFKVKQAPAWRDKLNVRRFPGPYLKLVGKDNVVAKILPLTEALKVYVALPDELDNLKNKSPHNGSFPDNPRLTLFPQMLVSTGTVSETTEGNDKYLAAFMREKKVQVMNWLSLSSGTYRVVPDDSRVSTCQLEVTASGRNIVLLASSRTELVTQRLPEIAPLRVLSFDVETMVFRPTPPATRAPFPHPTTSEVLQISNIISRRYGKDQSMELSSRVIFTLGKCAAISGAQVFWFDTEEELLLSWHQFVKSIDPDVITGYNMGRFDLPFLLARAKILGIQDTFGRLGRLEGGMLLLSAESWSFMRVCVPDPCLHFSPWDANAPQNEWKDMPIVPGRITFDASNYIARNKFALGLASARLGDVALQLLGEAKLDLCFELVQDYQEGGPETRRRMALYCLKDAYLVQRLLDVHSCLRNDLALARGNSVTVEELATRNGNRNAH